MKGECESLRTFELIINLKTTKALGGDPLGAAVVKPPDAPRLS